MRTISLRSLIFCFIRLLKICHAPARVRRRGRVPKNDHDHGARTRSPQLIGFPATAEGFIERHQIRRHIGFAEGQIALRSIYRALSVKDIEERH